MNVLEAPHRESTLRSHNAIRYPPSLRRPGCCFFLKHKSRDDDVKRRSWAVAVTSSECPTKGAAGAGSRVVQCGPRAAGSVGGSRTGTGAALCVLTDSAASTNRSSLPQWARPGHHCTPLPYHRWIEAFMPWRCSTSVWCCPQWYENGAAARFGIINKHRCPERSVRIETQLYSLILKETMV